MPLDLLILFRVSGTEVDDRAVAELISGLREVNWADPGTPDAEKLDLLRDRTAATACR